ncbi:MAG: hypothetical protein K0U74_12615 [Alphaproteobacteria bacterium]|nr:hypothetical protein [Alphaproteobacteria bacterium]
MASENETRPESGNSPASPDGAGGGNGLPAGGTERGGAPLNDVMIAMDVVDTLRHDSSMVERELNDDARRQDLIDRLREIYKGQGIEVPDRILEEGVKALEEDRFSYEPPDPNALATKLAKLYVTRWSWGRYVLGIVGGLIAFFLVNYAVYQRPQHLAAQAHKQELTALPGRIKKLTADIRSEAADPLVAARAEGVAKSGLNAATGGNRIEAAKVENELKETLARLRTEYKIRIVNRQGEVSGLWRIPKANPETYNFYLVVEAIGPDGKPIPQKITNEETGKTQTVSTWAVRVDRDVLVSVKADKDDDGIIQNRIVGRKVRGRLDPDWTIAAKGGAITRWK